MNASGRKPPRLPHVKHVRRGTKWYSYFNTGQKKDGKPIRAPLPPFGSVGFYDSLAGYEAGLTKRAVKSYTVASLVADYTKSRKFAERAENTRKMYQVQLDRIENLLGEFAVDDLQPADVRLVADARKWNAGTHNAFLAVLGALYTWGRKNEKTKASPVKDVERMSGGEHAPWPDDIVEAALTSDDDLIRLATHLLYFTGQRIGDACNIRWGDIRGGVLHITPQKTSRYKKSLFVPIAKELVIELAQTPRRGITVMHGFDSRAVRIALCAFTERLGVKTVPHGLRKNAVNALLEAGCTIAEVASITGQTYQIVEHYAAKVNNRKLGQAAMLKFDASRPTRRA